MLNIGQFFKRIQSKQTQEAFVHQVIQDAIKKHTGIEVTFERKGGEIRTKNISAALKSQLFIKKAQILKEINTQQQSIVVSDIQ